MERNYFNKAAGEAAKLQKDTKEEEKTINRRMAFRAEQAAKRWEQATEAATFRQERRAKCWEKEKKTGEPPITPQERVSREKMAKAIKDMKALMTPTYRHIIYYQEKAVAFVLADVSPELQSMAQETWSHEYRAIARYPDYLNGPIEGPIFLFMKFREDQLDPHDSRHRDICQCLNEKYASAMWDGPNQVPLQVYADMVMAHPHTVPLGFGLGTHAPTGGVIYARWPRRFKATPGTGDAAGAVDGGPAKEIVGAAAAELKAEGKELVRPDRLDPILWDRM